MRWLLTSVVTGYETVIGLEVHVQLDTRSKMFCSCSADYAGAAPNTHVCPVCLGMPGVLPVINERAIRHIATAGLALNCTIAEYSKFDRKNYPYPDLMKGYQITQYDLPVCVGGWLDVEVDGEISRVHLTRIHMEEDTARLLHRTDPATGEGYSLVDVNRSGTPLMEIVTEPDIRSPEQARECLVRLRQILRYAGVSEANMDEGQMRCDANISLRPIGSDRLGTKVEIKNMNSFRAVYDALRFERERQRSVLEAGERVRQETRGWNEERNETQSQRSKEEADDYRYFPEPDLPPLRLKRSYIEELRAALPELPASRQARYLALGLSAHEATTLAETRERSDYFEALAGALDGAPERAAKLAANWVLGEVGRWANETYEDIAHFPIAPAALAGLIGMVERDEVTGAVGKQVFDEMVATGRSAAEIVKTSGLAAISGTDELAGIVQSVIAGSEKAVADYHAGKASAIGFLLGQVMRQTGGKASPQVARDLLESELQKND